jgi:hypothetical protein
MRANVTRIMSSDGWQFPTEEQWTGMLRHHPEDTARSLYMVALDWHKATPQDGHLLKLVQMAEVVLSEMYPDFQKQN